MNKELEYIRIEDKKYIEYIIQLTYKSPLNYLKEISNKMKSYEKAGYLLMDTFLYSGKVDNRFIELYWNGKCIEQDTIKYIKLLQSKYKKITNNYIRKNKEILEDSVLSELQKKMILKGIYM